MTKDQLATELMRSMKGPIEKFVSQPSPDAKNAEAGRDLVEKQKKELAKLLGEGSMAYKAAAETLDEELRGNTVDAKAQRKENLHLAAGALMVIANELRLPLQMKPEKPGKGRKGGRRTRMTAAAMAKSINAVYQELPKGANDYISKAELAEKVGFDPSSVLLKMKRTGEAISNGRRGSGGAWRRGKKVD